MKMPNMVLKGEFLQFEPVLAERFSIRREYEKGETILGLNADRDRACYYLESGRVAFDYLNDRGESGLSTIRESGTIFPLYTSFYSTATQKTLEVVALTHVKCIVLQKRELRALMLEKPEIALAMIDAYNEYSSYLLYSVEGVMFDSLVSRVAGFLMLHADDEGNLFMTQEQLSRAVGASREGTSKALSCLQHGALIEMKRCCISIKDADELRQVAPMVVNERD